MTVIQGRTLPLPADMTRCLGANCERRETCARYKTNDVDKRGKTYSCGLNLCEGVAQDFYIETLERAT